MLNKGFLVKISGAKKIKIQVLINYVLAKYAFDYEGQMLRRLYEKKEF